MDPTPDNLYPQRVSMSSLPSPVKSVMSSPVGPQGKLECDSASVEPGDPVRHETFFEHEQPLVVFQVQGVLFRLRRLPFLDSSFFAAMFNLPPIKGEITDGTQEPRPLQILGVTVFEFEQLARLLITPFSSIIRPFRVNESEAILRLSTMWDFEDLRQYAIKTIKEHQNGINPATMARMAKRHDVSE
ncbi:hypothetical protein FRB94_010738 [Tulasnella sp. JGI-2019a]|nr:hypothetical protein FRB94_010738 [Tulasnella sp. JGI-2019a]KAG8997028.1 hypothetical protein FRB93_000521 [Tulasnella sp. JGI-2019a]KAG9021449.1 hypothetical protein FRB95_002092 [Tulasnella sp. JGI-2019a]